MRRFVPAVMLLIAGLAHAVPTSTSASTPDAAMRDPLIATKRYDIAFSPNADGRKDTGPITFSLERSARVKVRVVIGEGDGTVVLGPRRLGRLPRGQHVWRWDGRGEGGRPVADGNYEVWLTARRGDRKELLGVRTTVASTMARGTLATTRLPVYPQATQVADRVLLVYLFPGWSHVEEFYSQGVHRVAFEIRTAAGDVVRRHVVRDLATPSFAWYARQGDGSPMPAGDYLARVTVHDGAGNRRVFKKHLTVSHSELVEAIYSPDTLPAAQTRTFETAGHGDSCGPVPSDRFPDGLSFRPCSYSSLETFTHSVPFPAAPVDSYRVSATGGPTEPGTADQGHLHGTSTVPGDGTTTTPWLAPSLTSHPFLPGLSDAMWWLLITLPPDSYDVGTFTAEYRHYCEPADQDCLNP
jgi:flagellar hook assembly protein FlgD